MNNRLKEIPPIDNIKMELYKKLSKSQLIEKLLKLEDRLTKLENIISPPPQVKSQLVLEPKKVESIPPQFRDKPKIVT